MSVLPNHAPTLFYDGTCGVCLRSVQFILKHERGTSLRFARRDGVFNDALLAEHPELKSVESLIWRNAVRTHPRLLRRGLCGRDLPRRHLELAGPARVADPTNRCAIGPTSASPRNRHRFMRSGPACLRPSPAQRRRFLDDSAPENRQ